MLQGRKWQDESNLNFHRFHKHSRMKELSLNTTKEQHSVSQFNFLLDATRKNKIDSDTNQTQCLALLPSTETWIWVDCSKEFQNVTYLCEYTEFLENVTGTTSAEYDKQNKTPAIPAYCNENWLHIHNPEGGTFCIRIARVKRNKIESLDELNKTCWEIGGKMFDYADYYGVRSLHYYIPFFLKAGVYFILLSTYHNAEPRGIHLENYGFQKYN